jgi:signal peptidase I
LRARLAHCDSRQCPTDRGQAADRGTTISLTSKRAKAKHSGLGETVRTIIYAVLIALVVRTVAFEPFNIPSGSMTPTLLVGDYLFVSKYSYGYSRYSLPFSPDLFDGRILEAPPEVGDVVVFKKPTNLDQDYIKRVVGLPGDRIQMIAGILHINGTPVGRELVGPSVYVDNNGRPSDVLEYIETLPNGVQHRIFEYSDTYRLDNTQEWIVPEGNFFAMGDFRDNSLDSRADVGFVPFENLVGRAEFIFYSTDGSAEIWEFWKWPAATRWERLFDGIG